MNSKGDFELSVKLIVILIVALLVLGLVIGFVVTKFRGAAGKLYITEPTPEPDAETPIQTPGGRESFSIGKANEVEMGLSIYNSQNSDYVSDVTNATIFECVSATGRTVYFSPNLPQTVIPAGQVGQVPALFGVGGATQPGLYACQIILKVFPDWSGRHATTKLPFGVQGPVMAQRYMEIEVG